MDILSKVSNYIIILLVALLLCFCNQQDTPATAGSNLKPVFSFGTDGKGIQSNPVDLEANRNGQIFITDQGRKKVLSYNLKGKFQSIVGDNGRGPGEYLSPLVIASTGSHLYIQDVGNIRLLRYNLQNGETLVINQDNNFLNFDVSDSTILGFDPVSMIQEPPSKRGTLISVFDTAGTPLHSFGNYLSKTENLPAGMSWPYIQIENDIIHLVFQYFPLYKRFNKNGELLLKVNLSDSSHVENPTNNYEEDTYNNIQSGKSSGFSAVFRAMDVFKNRLFICRQNNSITIDEYLLTDQSIKHRNTYRYENADLPDRYHVRDFFYNRDRNAFYILEQNKSPQVTVYQIQEGESN